MMSSGNGSGGVRRSFTSSPEGAEVQLKNYVDVGGPWESIGRTPVRGYRLPLAMYRARLTLAGHDPVEISISDDAQNAVRLWPTGTTPPGMTFVPGGRYAIGVASAVTLPDFWIDRTEVTNQDYKRFVDAGGYRNAQFWKHPFTTPDGTMTFEDAMARFRDATGRPGPAVWELGSYPEGRAEYPVSGISWFEAAAFAEFTGKSLPTIYHWHRAAGADSPHSYVLRLSNFDGKGLEPVGRRAGVGPWGTLDMAGNAKEWCLNASARTDVRYILGGAWNEPAYRFRDPDAADPWQRGQAFGIRLVKNLGPVGDAAEPVPTLHGDPQSLVPVADVQFEVLKGFYAYDRAPLAAKVEAVDDSSPNFRRETVSFAAAYGGERIPAHLYLPKNARPPYQTVLYFPNAYARQTKSSSQLDMAVFEFVVRSGRALLYPVYKGTFERGGGTPADRAERRARHARGLGQGCVPRGRLPRDTPGPRHQPACVLQHQHGRILRSDSGRARATPQAGDLCLGWSTVQLSGGDPAGQLHAAGEGAGFARERPG